jgi:hypothetical protein
MLKENDFRRIALGMKDAIESAHMGHPDFRINGRIFATLHHDRLTAGRGQMVGMVVLTPEQQQDFMRDHPATFTPESGAWGRSGCTRVQLDAVDEDILGDAMTRAWQNAVQKAPGAPRGGRQKTTRKPTAVKTKAVKTKTVKTRAVKKRASAR